MYKCTLCGCCECPNNEFCSRKPQPFTIFLPCPACGCLGSCYFARKKIGDLEWLENQKEDDMINIAGNGGGGARPQGQRQRGGLPFLKAENVTAEKRVAKILGTKQGEDQRGKGKVSLKIAFAGNTYLWDLRLNNPNLATLVGLFGQHEEQWVGEQFLLGLQEDEFTNVSWPTVFASEEPKKKAARA